MRPIRLGCADLATMANGLMGILAISYLVDASRRDSEVHLMYGVLLLFAAMVFDTMDGWLARRFGSKHRLGHVFDSLADTVSFCVAPGLLVYTRFFDSGAGFDWPYVALAKVLTLTTALAIALFGMVRLSRFVRSKHRLGHFSGLPTPAMTWATCTAILIAAVGDADPGLHTALPLWELLLVLTTLLTVSLLMLADVAYPKLRGRMLSASAGLIAAAFSAVILRIETLRRIIEGEEPAPVSTAAGLLAGVAAAAIALYIATPLYLHVADARTPRPSNTKRRSGRIWP